MQEKNISSEQDSSRLWYQMDEAAVLEALATSRSGLSPETARERQQQFGVNELEFKKTPAWVRFLRQFNDPMVIILLITAIITGVLTAFGHHMLPDTLVIAGVVVMNSILGFVQEGKAEGALDALRNMMVQECLVVRAGNQQMIAARDLVPGDIVVLEGGNKIPADVRFIETNNAHIDESSLTGESVPVQKSTEPLQGGPDLVPGDQRNMGFSGTYLTQGSALTVVVAIGTETVFGKIAGLVQAADSGVTPLQKKMQEFVHTLIIAILIVGGLNFLLGIYLGYEMSYSFLGAVSLVVASIPEMLPALVTSILALSCTVMAGRKALIRKLPAAETLGATSVICSDKTGTLTENRMTVTRIFAGGQVYSVTGSGEAIEGKFLLENEAQDVHAHPALLQTLYTGFYCNNASLTVHGPATGDPTEIALRVSGAKAELMVESVHRCTEIPFDSSTKYMAVLVKDREQPYILVKGAPEMVVSMCATQLNEKGEQEPIDREQVLAAAKDFAGDALRTLAFAILPVTSDCNDLSHDQLEGLCLAGLQGMIDPPKQSAIEAVAQCKQAGIRTVMITGDHPDTAQAVARQLGIAADHAMTGTELTGLSDEELFQVVEKVSVFARVAPEHKQRIAESLQSHDLVVAMTGDGVNDAPALKAADIGIAMGISGTEVAKEASDMVLADDNFATIVAAVEEGRHAWNNLRKAILYTLPTNAAQALLIIGAIFMASFIPLFSIRFVLEPVQILWVNLLDSVLLTMPLMMEAKEKGLLQSPPRSSHVRIIDALFLRRVVFLGLAISLPGFWIYHHFGAAAVVDGQLVDPLLLTQAQTAAFWAILFAHFGYVISARSVDASVFTFNPLGNRWLLAGIALSIMIRFIPTAIPAAASLFRTAPFPAEWWPLILVCFFPSLIMIELDKLLGKMGVFRLARGAR
ncbi:MAG: HAD-IC family P-type ATPase [Candidatus Electrothrix aestuarii]|uniref:HAD-IC family P-type ATPase n=1 Tax=Candidatus Electrothrix aestuarii TaxID=3062594 RepID=A0AAU8LYL9_9BACT